MWLEGISKVHLICLTCNLSEFLKAIHLDIFWTQQMKLQLNPTTSGILLLSTRGRGVDNNDILRVQVGFNWLLSHASLSLWCAHVVVVMSRQDETSKRICCPGTSSPFCLGMTDYNCCDIPEPKCKKLTRTWRSQSHYRHLLVLIPPSVAKK